MGTTITDILGGKKVLHKEPSSRFDFIEISNDGIPKLTVTYLAKYLQISLNQISRLLPISERTIQRKKDKDPLDKVVSEKILHIAEIAARGTVVFENREKFLVWLNRPCAAFGDRSPMSLLYSSDGINIVLEEIGRIEHGIFA